MTNSQLLEIRDAMEEEHRRDREALARLTRFLPSANIPDKQSASNVFESTQENKRESRRIKKDDQLSPMDQKFLKVMMSSSDREWIVVDLVKQFIAQAYGSGLTQGPEGNIIAQRSLRHLRAHGLVEVVQESAGRRPGVYRLTEQGRQVMPETLAS